MAKKQSYYFQHDSNAREDDKIVAIRMKHGSAGYGVYFMLLELLSTSDNFMYKRDYNKLGYILHDRADVIKDVVENYGLFQFADDGKLFYSARLSRHMESILETANRMSELGKKSAQKRNAGSTDSSTHVERTLNGRSTHVQQIIEDKIIEDNNSSSTSHAGVHIDIESLFVEFRQELAGETRAIEDAMRLFKRTQAEILAGLDDFQAKLRLEGKPTTTRTDYRQHFNNWFRIQCDKQNKQNDKQNGQQQPDLRQRLNVSRTTGPLSADF